MNEDPVTDEQSELSRTDQVRSTPSVVVCPDGPLLVRDDVDIVTAAGEPVPRKRKTVALCRCGSSAIKPYCDGTHKLTGFRTND